jgi:hypothetical protein
MELGAFSISLTVSDIGASQAFYEKLGCIIRAMPTIDSDGCRPPVPGYADHSFRQHGVPLFLEHRNRWSPWFGSGGRLAPEFGKAKLIQ